MDQGKLIPYDSCTDDRLKGFFDLVYVKEVCYHLYGESKQDYCKVKKDFCEYCCHYHVGVKFYLQRGECKKKCTKLIGYNPNPNEKIKLLNKANKNKKGKGKGKGKGKKSRKRRNRSKMK
jgi:hypothetical protein